MDERAQRLLPRLFAMLDTLHSDAEIVATVHRIRAIGGAAAFHLHQAPAAADDVSLEHPDHRTALRLRSLGLLLRLLDPLGIELQAAVERTRLALVNGGSVARLDLLAALGHLREILGADLGRSILRAMEGNEGRMGGYAQNVDRVQDQLRDSMDELCSRISRP